MRKCKCPSQALQTFFRVSLASLLKLQGKVQMSSCEKTAGVPPEDSPLASWCVDGVANMQQMQNLKNKQKEYKHLMVFKEVPHVDDADEDVNLERQQDSRLLVKNGTMWSPLRSYMETYKHPPEFLFKTNSLGNDKLHQQFWNIWYMRHNDNTWIPKRICTCLFQQVFQNKCNICTCLYTCTVNVITHLERSTLLSPFSKVLPLIKTAGSHMRETESSVVSWAQGVSVITVLNLCSRLPRSQTDSNHSLLIQAIVLLIPDTYDDTCWKPPCDVWLPACVNCFSWQCGWLSNGGMDPNKKRC